eukprot:763889-Hanusia_phi.AAC.3
MPSAYIRGAGSIDTSAQEATDITGVAEDTVKRMVRRRGGAGGEGCDREEPDTLEQLKGRQELLMQKPGQQQATLVRESSVFSPFSSQTDVEAGSQTKTIKDLVNVNERLKQKVLALQKVRNHSQLQVTREFDMSGNRT